MFRVNPDKITVIPHGVNPQTYYPDPDIKKITNQISYLGEAKRSKGMDSIIKAFQLVLKKKPEATLKLASKCNELEKMKKLASELLPAGSYEFVEFVPENKMRTFYNQSDIFVFPSRYGFGLSSLEAMACGTPSIVGDTLDAKEIYTDKDIIVNPDNHEDLADKILNLLNDRALYNNKREEAITLAKQFHWDEICERYFQVCLNAAK